MKKIFKFTAPNGEIIKWGNFDDKKTVSSLVVDKFSDDGYLLETESIQFVLPEDIRNKSEWDILTSHRTVHYDKEEETDNRKILTD